MSECENVKNGFPECALVAKLKAKLEYERESVAKLEIMVHQKDVDLWAELQQEREANAKHQWIPVSEAGIQKGLHIEGWHIIHKCAIAIKLGEEGWIEVSGTTIWPFKAFSHIRPCSAPPADGGE